MSDTPNTPDTSEQNFAALRAKHEAAERENAFLRAGVDVDSAQGKLLMRGYEGALDVDAIRAYRDEVFPPAAPAATPDPANADPAAGQPTPDPDTDPYRRDLAGQQAVRDALGAPAGTGQTQTAPPAKPVLDDALEQFHAERRAGVPMETAQLAAIDRMIVGAVNGDSSALFDQADWARRQAEAGHSPRREMVQQ